MKKALLIIATVILLTSCATVSNQLADVPDEEIVQGNEQQKESVDAPEQEEILEESDIPGADISFGFIPDDTYGELLPYVGEYSEIPASENNYEKVFLKYGLCTSDGEIIVDAKDNVISYIDCHTADDGFSYYTMGIGKVEDYSYDGFHPQKTCIIPTDGSWCIELEEGWWGFCDGFGGICASLTAEGDFDGSSWEYLSETLLFDYDGNEISELGQSTIVYCDTPDYFCINLFDASPRDSESVYVNRLGEIMDLSSYKTNDFNSFGVAVKRSEDGSFLFKDSGEMLTDKYYSFIDYHESHDGKSGVFAARYDGENDIYKFDFYDMNGNRLLSDTVICADYKYVDFYFSENGDTVVEFKTDEGTDYLNLSTGVVVLQDNIGRYCYSKICENLIFRDGRTYGGGSAWILDCNGNERFIIEDFEALNDVSADGSFVAYTVGATDFDNANFDYFNYSVEADKRVTYLYDMVKGEVLYSLHGNCEVDFIGKDDRFVRMYNNDSLEGGNTYNYALYDTEKGTLVVDNAECICHYVVGVRDFFAVGYHDKTVLFDSEMNEIISCEKLN